MVGKFPYRLIYVKINFPSDLNFHFYLLLTLVNDIETNLQINKLMMQIWTISKHQLAITR